MLDAAVRTRIEGPLAAAARVLDHRYVTPDRLTAAGLLLGLGAAAAAAASLWWTALVLWIASRAADGLDGALARVRDPVDRRLAGGFVDITADFVVYGAFVVGVAIGWGGSLLPFLLVLLAYYVNGSAFLAYSGLAADTSARLDDGRSLSFLAGLAEGTETVAVHALWCVLPFWAGGIAWVWAAFVMVSGIVRIAQGRRALLQVDR